MTKRMLLATVVCLVLLACSTTVFAADGDMTMNQMMTMSKDSMMMMSNDQLMTMLNDQRVIKSDKRFMDRMMKMMSSDQIAACMSDSSMSGWRTMSKDQWIASMNNMIMDMTKDQVKMMKNKMMMVMTKDQMMSMMAMKSDDLRKIMTKEQMKTMQVDENNVETGAFYTGGN